MKLENAFRVMNQNYSPPIKGYVVQFVWKYGKILGKERPNGTVVIESFPDLAVGEMPILSSDEAHYYARKISEALKDQISDVTVVPVETLSSYDLPVYRDKRECYL